MPENVFKKETIETVDKLRLIDDSLFRLVAADPAACQEILRNILDDDKLIVVGRPTPQYVITSLAREIILDVLCQTFDGTYVNVEMQTGNHNDDERRTRFHAAAITTAKTKKGTEFGDIPNVTVVYITEYDALKNDQTVTFCGRYFTKHGELVRANDGEAIYYANTAVKDGTPHTELLQLLLNREPFDNPDFPALSERMRYYKGTEKGRQEMCAVVENYAKDYARNVSILDAIQVLRTAKVPENEIKNIIMQKYALKSEEADAYMKQSAA